MTCMGDQRTFDRTNENGACTCVTNYSAQEAKNTRGTKRTREREKRKRIRERDAR